MRRHKPEHLPRFSVALLSAAALAAEILFLQLFSIIQYHHFAAVIIGLALLGYAVSGTTLFLFRVPLMKHHTTVVPAAMLLFGITVVLAFLLAQRIPFNGEELLWNPTQIMLLTGICLLVSLPFFCCAGAIGLAFLCYRQQIGLLYAADLLGAGCGSLLIIVVMFFLAPEQILVVIGSAGAAAATLALYEINHPQRHRLAAFIGTGSIIAALLVGPWLTVHPSSYKSLSGHLRIDGSTIVITRSSPLGQVTVVKNDLVPFRHAPGLSLNTPVEPLPQLGIFINGDGPNVITRHAEYQQQLAYLDFLPSALPYHLFQPATALILGSGGGSDILQARYHGVDAITAVERNPTIAELLKTTFATYTDSLIDGVTVHLEVADIRQFIENNQQRFDLIQLALADGSGPSAAGMYAAHANYLYTVEAFGAYLADLADHGILSLSRWVANPPRDTLKVVATAVAALHEMGIERVADHLIVIRSWQTSTVLVGKQPFTTQAIERVRTFCRDRSFDIAWAPMIDIEETNRFNILPTPIFYESIQALVGDQPASFIDAYKFNITPATDNRPYFHHFFTWRAAKEMLALHEQGGSALLEYGYVLLLGAVIAAGATGLLLILLPLWLLHSTGPSAGTVPERGRVLLFFFGTGIAFLTVEIAFLQRFTLFLHHPVYSASLIIATFLVGASIGSRVTPWCTARLGAYRTLLAALSVIVLLGALALLLLAPLFGRLSFLSLPGRMAASVLLIAPLAFFMGMPFPLALDRLSLDRQDLIPWAWGINGCASVFGAMLTALGSMHFGFTAVMIGALAVYATLALCFPPDSTVSAAP